MKKSILYIFLLFFGLLLSGCATKKALYKDLEYRNLLMYSQTPTEVFGHWHDGVFIQFQRFEQSMKDTVVVVKFDRKGRFSFAGGIEIEGDFVRRKFMDILHINGDAFFTYNYSNMGNSNNNIVRMSYIAPDGSLHKVEVVRADSLYSTTLPNNQFIWDEEEINFTQYPITSQFYIWDKTDIHSQPTVGIVSIVYRMQKTGTTKYTLYPEEINFAGRTFYTQDTQKAYSRLLKNEAVISFILKYCQFRDDNSICQNEADIVNRLIVDVLENIQNETAEQNERLKIKALETMYANSYAGEEDSYDHYRMAKRRHLCFIALALQSDKYRYKTFLNDARCCITDFGYVEEYLTHFSILDIIETLIMSDFEHFSNEMKRSIGKLQDNINALQESKHATPEFTEDYNNIVKLIIENISLNK